MKLVYQAYDRDGQTVTDTIEAASAGEATEQLRRQGLFVTRVGEAEDRSDPTRRTAVKKRISTSKRLKNLAVFTRGLYVLSSSGTALTDSLAGLERQTRDKVWRDVIGDVRQHVEQGQTLSEAMAAHPRVFDTVYRSLISAGETSGKFDAILERLSQLIRSQLQTRSAVIGALVYPSLLLVVAGSVLTMMVTFMLPRFSKLFDSMGLSVPPTTHTLIVLSTFLREYWWLLLVGMGILVFGLMGWLRTEPGRRVWDTVVLRLPVFGAIVRSFITARVIRLLGVLADSFVPLLDALDLTKQCAGNTHYERLITNAEEAVTRGEPISVALSNPKLISPTVYEAVRSGESTGKVAAMMLATADFLDEENAVMIKTLTSILEPIILIGMGLLVGLVALSMFLPLFDLMAQSGGS